MSLELGKWQGSRDAVRDGETYLMKSICDTRIVYSVFHLFLGISTAIGT